MNNNISGLNNLFKKSVSEESLKHSNEIDINLIDTNPNQPRKVFNEELIIELSESIKEHGIIQPLVVIPKGDRFELVAGERRLRASKLLGLDKVPVVIKNGLSEKNKELISIIENIQRSDLHFFETAQAYQNIMRKYEISSVELGKMLGVKESTIRNFIRLLDFSEPVKEKLITTNKVSLSHAKILAKIKTDDKKVFKVIDKIEKEDLSSRELEKVLNEVYKEEKPKEEKIKNDILAFKSLEDKIGCSQIKIKTVNNKITMSFLDEKELEKFMVFMRSLN